MDEIPFEKFEKLGISKQDFLAMPKELADTVVNGRVTPLMNTRIHAENGKVIEMHMKFSLPVMTMVTFCFRPIRCESRLTTLTT